MVKGYAARLLKKRVPRARNQIKIDSGVPIPPKQRIPQRLSKPGELEKVAVEMKVGDSVLVASGSAGRLKALLGRMGKEVYPTSPDVRIWVTDIWDKA